jgi:hypothetical protein
LLRVLSARELQFLGGKETLDMLPKIDRSATPPAPKPAAPRRSRPHLQVAPPSSRSEEDAEEPAVPDLDSEIDHETQRVIDSHTD